MKTIVNSNPTLFVQEVCDAIKEGFYFTNDNFGSITETNMLMVVLQGNENVIFEQVEDYKVSIVERDCNVFLEKVQGAVLSGMTLVLDSVQWDALRYKEAKFVNESHPRGVTYTREGLENTEWEEFKTLCKAFDVSGRDRSLMINKVLAIQENDV
jgi:hypothetical protein